MESFLLVNLINSKKNQSSPDWSFYNMIVRLTPYGTASKKNKKGLAS